jgi:hypothetical protein
VDIGNANKPYYGAAAGNRLTSLLRTHILEAVPVLQYAKAGDKARLNKAGGAWYANAHQIAAFLARANPHNWPLAMMDSMMKTHLALTTKEAVARLQGHWAADIAAFDQVHAEILDMSHMLAAGIIAQFPDRFWATKTLDRAAALPSAGRRPSASPAGRQRAGRGNRTCMWFSWFG